MKLLISTINNNVLIALYSNDDKLIKDENYLGNNDLIVTFYQKLSPFKEYFNQLTSVHVINGPGSFTGLRIGIITAKTISLEYKIPLLFLDAITFLETIYKQPVAIDARAKKYLIKSDDKFLKVLEDDLSQSYLKDPVIISEKTMDTLCLFKSVNPDDLEIIYANNI